MYCINECITHYGVVQALRLVLLLELLDLLQGEEGSSAAPHGLLGVVLAPLLVQLRVLAAHVLPQVLAVLRREVALLARERLLTWDVWKFIRPSLQKRRGNKQL